MTTVLHYQGVDIHPVWKNGDPDQGSRHYWFTLDPWCQENGCQCQGPCLNLFDVRDIYCELHALDKALNLVNVNDPMSILREGIDCGLLTTQGLATSLEVSHGV